MRTPTILLTALGSARAIWGGTNARTKGLRQRASGFALAAVLAFVPSLAIVRASEADALAISANIQGRHLPFGTVLDPIYASADSDQIVGYTRCGDSALWTGAYLAAESFRYRVTQSPEALRNLKAALAGLKALTDVTGDNRLARCMAPSSSPYAAGIANEEANNDIHINGPWIWVGNTSRPGGGHLLRTGCGVRPGRRRHREKRGQ